jgi:flagellar biosynthesis protein FlhF
MSAVAQVSPAAPVSAAAEKTSVAIDGELKALRRLLETQLAALAWNDLTRRSPVTAELVREFAALGIERDLAADVVATAPQSEDLAVARRHAHAALRDRIGVVEDRWTEQGGTLAIVGPAGSGKTSALAAIAARWVLRHGPAGAALVSAGDSRFGAFEHLARLGRLLGVPTYQVDDLDGVPELLARLGGQRLVLVDTPAVRIDDTEAAARSMAALREVCTLAVTLPATMQATALRLTAARHARIGATVAIATRLDEAASLGGLLSASIGAGLPFAYVTDGTRLPDDLRPARAEDLVGLAVSLVERNGTAADEELLVCRAEGRAHVAS